MDLYLLQKEVAQILGITVQSVHKLLKDHGIKTVPYGKRLQVIYPESFRQILKLKNLKLVKGTKIGVHIVKGGTGKTTLTHALATRAAALGHKVLAIDLDQQANLSHSFNVWANSKSDPTLFNVYEGHLQGKKIGIKDAIVELSSDFHLIPANLSLANLESALLSSTENLATLISSILKPIEKSYDLIFIDCPPALSKLTAAVQLYVNSLIIPVNPDSFSLEGLDLTLLHLKKMRKNYRSKTEINIVVNKFDGRHKLGLEVLRTLHEDYSQYLCDNFISVTKQIENSIAEGHCVWESRNKNQALDDIHALLIQILSLDVWKHDWKKNKLAKPTLRKTSSERTINA